MTNGCGKVYVDQAKTTLVDWSLISKSVRVRVHNGCLNCSFNSLEEMAKFSDAFWLVTPNFGRKSLAEFKKLCAHYNIPRGDLTCQDYDELYAERG